MTIADPEGPSKPANGTPANAAPTVAAPHDTVTALPRVVVDRDRPSQKPNARRAWLGAFIYRIRFLPLAWLLLVSGAFFGLYFQPPIIRIAIEKFGFVPGGGTSSPVVVAAPKPKSVPAAPPPVVVGLGKLLPEDDLNIISAPYGAGDARLAVLKVAEGDHVQQGDLLAVLDNEASLKVALDAAKTALAAKQASLDQTRANIRASRDESRAALARAQNTADNAQRELDRAEQLRKSGAVTDATLDQKRTARTDAQREIERLQATASRYGDDLETQPDVIVAARLRDSAKSDVDRAQNDLEKAYVRAPAEGTVLSIITQPGQKPGVDGLMRLGNLARMKADVEVYQTEIGRVAVGDSVELRAEALGQVLNGTVSRIGLEVGRQTLVDPSPAANTDARVVKVSVALGPEASRLASRFTNLQVVARINIAAAP